MPLSFCDGGERDGHLPDSVPMRMWLLDLELQTGKWRLVMGTKLKVFLLLSAAVSGFCFRAGERTVAAQLPTCPVHDCKDVFSWHVSGFNIASAHDANNNQYSHAMVLIHAPAPGAALPVIASGDVQAT